MSAQASFIEVGMPVRNRAVDLIALVLFLFIVKFLGWLMKLKKDEAAAAPPLTKDQELLTEIRDLLKKDRPDVPQPLLAI